MQDVFRLRLPDSAADAEALVPVLTPALQRLGLEPVDGPRRTKSDDRRPLYRLAGQESAGSLQRRLAEDPEWARAARRAGPLAAQVQLRPFRIQARGRVAAVGSGNHRGAWHRFTSRDGLPSSLIVQLIEDRRGHLWLRSYNEGVCRFDGCRFVAYRAASGLAGDAVNDMLEDADGRLWFATDSGLCRLDDGVFEHFDADDGLADDRIDALHVDRHGRLWAAAGAGSSVACLDGERFRYFALAAAGAARRPGQVRPFVKLLEDGSGSLWVVVHGRSYRHEGDAFVPREPGGGAAADRSVATDREGRVWFSDASGPVAVHDGERFGRPPGPLPAEGGRFLAQGRDGRRWFVRDGALLAVDESVTRFTPAASAHMLQDPVVAEDGSGNTWFGTFGAGALRCDGRGLTHYRAVDGLGHDRVCALLGDRGGRLWCGTWGGGLNRFDGQRLDCLGIPQGLPHHEVETICRDRTGALWFGTRGGGACRLDADGFVAFGIADGLSDDWVWCIHEGSEGCLWFGTQRGGVCCFEHGRFETLDAAFGLSRCAVFDICEDRAGRLWLATEGAGLHCLEHGHLRTYTVADGLPSDWVWSVREDRHGDMWCTTWSGVARFDGGAFHAYTAADGLGHSNVWCMLEDRRGVLWFGTWGGGVTRFDGRTFETFTRHDGLADDNVRCLFEDRQGVLWLGTYGGGVSRFDGRVFQSLDRRDGLPHDAVQAILQDGAGDMWLATEDGVARYRPGAEKPAVELTGVVADRRFEPAAEITVPASPHVVTFEFQGSSFSVSPDRIAYVYRLAGHEREWRAAYEGRVEYRGLPSGSFVFQVRAVDRDLNESEEASVSVQVVADSRQEHIEALHAQLSEPPGLEPFIGKSAALRRVLAQLQTVAATDVTVLILGETGTGKGLAAQALHAMSGRQQPFIALNCGAIPDGLVESELFGHERGAFTGAVGRKIGRFELAHGGTLFLDEIGDLPERAQQALLQVLQDGTLQRVGGDRTLSVDVRVLAATNRDLVAAMHQGTFREDLYYRLSAFTVELPPLRGRRDDVMALFRHFVERFSRHLNRPVPDIDPDVWEVLVGYPWPGNVRELQHCSQRAVLICDGRIAPADVSQSGVAPAAHATTPDAPADLPSTAAVRPLEESEADLIRRALEASDGVIYGDRGAARMLGIHPERLRVKMRRHGLRRRRD